MSGNCLRLVSRLDSNHLSMSNECCARLQVCSPGNANVGLLAYSPLAGGSLTGKYQDGGNKTSRFNLFPGLPARFQRSTCIFCRHVIRLVDEGLRLVMSGALLAGQADISICLFCAGYMERFNKVTLHPQPHCSLYSVESSGPISRVAWEQDQNPTGNWHGAVAGEAGGF